MPLQKIIGICLGYSATLTGLVAVYYLFRASKNLAGGILGSAFRRLAIGIALVIFSIQFTGITAGHLDLRGIWITAVSAGTDLLGVIFLLAGARGILKSTK